MFKIRGFSLIFICLLTACSQDTVIPKEQIQEEKNDENIVVTADGKTTFEIINNMEAPKKTVDTIKDELRKAYDDIMQSIHTSYVPSEHITVFLNEGTPSWGLASKIELDLSQENYPLVHELTHSLLGYGGNFDTDNGYFTQEGFAVYMEDQYGKNELYLEKYMKHFLDSDKLIPISKLIDPNQDDGYFRADLPNKEEQSVLWEMSYAHAASFVKYLVDIYGLDKFEQIYDKRDLANKIEEVYGKSVSEIEMDWLAFINNQKGFTHQEKFNLPDFYDKNTTILRLDPIYFAKEPS
ncbi:hypothetical protein [Lysinibacillus cavernae]|uniref:hypothetical protein n=1 Tax=Lysinibacillus cavernae TaxID=2666135 RepID=UPI0012D8C5AD|nr:hypothetical protein [Lysinibacillus cavernae]